MDTFVSHLFPTYNFMQLIGLVPLAVNNTAQVSTNRWIQTYCLCLSALSVFIAYVVVDQQSSQSASTLHITQILDSVHTSLVTIAYTIGMFESLLKRKSHRTMFEISTRLLIANKQTNTQTHCPRRGYACFKVSRRHVWFSAIVLVYALPHLVVTIPKLCTVKNKMFYGGRHVLAPMVTNFRNAQVLTCVMAVEQWLMRLNDAFERKRRLGPCTIGDVQQFVRLSDLTCQLVDVINDIFGWFVYVSNFIDTMHISATLFTLVCKANATIVMAMLELAAPIASILGLSVYCHRSTSQVSIVYTF